MYEILRYLVRNQLKTSFEIMKNDKYQAKNDNLIDKYVKIKPYINAFERGESIFRKIQKIINQKMLRQSLKTIKGYVIAINKKRSTCFNL